MEALPAHQVEADAVEEAVAVGVGLDRLEDLGEAGLEDFVHVLRHSVPPGLVVGQLLPQLRHQPRHFSPVLLNLSHQPDVFVRALELPKLRAALPVDLALAAALEVSEVLDDSSSNADVLGRKEALENFLLAALPHQWRGLFLRHLRLLRCLSLLGLLSGLPC